MLKDLISHKINVSNKVNEKPIYYYCNQVNLNSNNFTNPGQVILVNCTNSVVSQLNIVNGSEGISLYYC